MVCNSFNDNTNSRLCLSAWRVYLLALLISCLLVSQFLGIIHSIYHPSSNFSKQLLGSARTEQNTFVDLKLKNTSTISSLLDSHFGFTESNECGSLDCEKDVVKNCNLFESLIYSVCVGRYLVLYWYGFSWCSASTLASKTPPQTSSNPLRCKPSWLRSYPLPLWFHIKETLNQRPVQALVRI